MLTVLQAIFKSNRRLGFWIKKQQTISRTRQCVKAGLTSNPFIHDAVWADLWVSKMKEVQETQYVK
jgi:hypothetical protein